MIRAASLVALRASRCVAQTQARNACSSSLTCLTHPVSFVRTMNTRACAWLFSTEQSINHILTEAVESSVADPRISVQDRLTYGSNPSFSSCGHQSVEMFIAARLKKVVSGLELCSVITHHRSCLCVVSVSQTHTTDIRCCSG